MEEVKKIVPLKDVCLDFIVPQRDKPKAFDGNIPWCRIEDIDGRYLNGSKSGQNVTKELADKMNMHLCPKGTVISACSASIGNQAITTIDCYTNQTFIGLVVNPNLLYNVYLYYFLESQTNNLLKLGQGATIKYISKDKYKRMLIPLPSLSKQQSIVDYLDSVFAKTDAIKRNAEKQLAEARALFQSALTQAMQPKPGWKSCKFNEIIDNLRTGLNPRTHFKLNTSDSVGYYITVRELKGFTFEVDKRTDRINKDAIKRINERSNLKIGDVLYSGTGTIGKTALVQELPTWWNIKEGVYAITPKANILDSSFLIYAMHSDYFMSEVLSKTSGTTVRSIPMKMLKEIVLSIPLITEQQAIVEHLDALSNNVKELEEICRKTAAECDALKQALLRQIFE